LTKQKDHLYEQQRKFLYKQAEELFKYRERSIESISSTYSAYVKFLPILAVAIGVFIKIDDNVLTDSIFWIVIFFTGIAVFTYGCYIHHLLISSYINLNIYTKKINLTRSYLMPTGYENKTLLPYTAKEPNFGEQGYLEEDISKIGVVAFMRWANSIIAFISFSILFYLLLLLCKEFWLELECCKLISSVFFGLIFGYISYEHHKKHYNEKIDKAKGFWNNRDLRKFDPP
jgi:hypothetical protein